MLASPFNILKVVSSISVQKSSYAMSRVVDQGATHDIEITELKPPIGATALVKIEFHGDLS